MKLLKFIIIQFNTWVKRLQCANGNEKDDKKNENYWLRLQTKFNITDQKKILSINIQLLKKLFTCSGMAFISDQYLHQKQL